MSKQTLSAKAVTEMLDANYKLGVRDGQRSSRAAATAKVWAALHNPMTEESVAYTVSLHRTKEGAEAAVDASKAAVKSEHDRFVALMKEVGGPADPLDYGEWSQWHRWGVEEMEVLP